MELHIILQLMRDYLLRRGGLRNIIALLLRLLGKRVLLSLSFDLTYQCQCNCRHCANKQYKKGGKELKTSEIFNIIDSTIPLGLIHISFIGGETTLRDDLARIILYANKRGVFTSLNTNGILLEEKVSSYAKAGINRINVSIDSASPEIHDFWRGYPGCLNLAISGIKKSLSLGVDTRISTVVMKGKVSEINGVIKLGKKLGVSNVRIAYPIPAGKVNVKDVLSEEEYRQAKKIMDHSFSYNQREDGALTGCGAGITLMNISPYGGVKPCSFMPIEFGNVRYEPINQIWQRMGKHWAFNKSVPFCWMRDPEFRKRELNLGI